MNISIRLSKEIAKRLNRVVLATSQPRNYLIVKALEAYLRDYQYALDRLEGIRKSPLFHEMRKSLTSHK